MALGWGNDSCKVAVAESMQILVETYTLNLSDDMHLNSVLVFLDNNTLPVRYIYICTS